MLDGSTTSCDWATDKDAVEPGLFGPSHLPHLFRRDYVTNSNDSYWLSNPATRSTASRGSSATKAPRSLRTRIGLIMTAQNAKRRVHPADDAERGLQQPAVRRRSDARQTWSRCATSTRAARVTSRPRPTGRSQSATLHVLRSGTCTRTPARVARFSSADSSTTCPARRRTLPTPQRHVCAVLEDAVRLDDAVHTPNGLNTADPEVLAALGDAINDLNTAKLPLDVTVGAVQYVEKNGVRYPIHGGTGDPNGDFNAIWTGWVDGKGLTQPDGGSSFVQVVTWNNGQCPDARTILTYSLSTDPTEPHYADQTALFSEKRWVTDRFCAWRDRAAPVHQVKHLVA